MYPNHIIFLFFYRYRSCLLLLPPSAHCVLVLQRISSILEDPIPIPLAVIPDSQPGHIHPHHSHSPVHSCSIYPHYCHYVSTCLWKICCSSSYRGTWIWYCSFSTNLLSGEGSRHNILFTNSAHPCHFDCRNDHAHNIILDHTQSKKYDNHCKSSCINIICIPNQDTFVSPTSWLNPVESNQTL